jgi:hypothetical protein
MAKEKTGTGVGFNPKTRPQRRGNPNKARRHRKKLGPRHVDRVNR